MSSHISPALGAIVIGALAAMSSLMSPALAQGTPDQDMAWIHGDVDRQAAADALANHHLVEEGMAWMMFEKERNARAAAHLSTSRIQHRQELMQARNVATILADIDAGRPVDMGKVYRDARLGLIGPAGLVAIHDAQERRAQGTTDTLALLSLYRRLGKGTLEPEEIVRAAKAGAIGGNGISASDAIDLMKALNEQRSVERAAVR